MHCTTQGIAGNPTGRFTKVGVIQQKAVKHIALAATNDFHTLLGIRQKLPQG